jgi:hypothetical protein
MLYKRLYFITLLTYLYNDAIMDEKEHKYYASLDKCLLGRVRVDISSLILSDLSRKDDPRTTKKKRGSKSRSRYDPQSRISADIDPDDLDHMLRLSLLSKEDLQKSLLPGAIHPRINTTDVMIRCFNGRHRLKVAEVGYKDGDCWWEIELYCFEKNRRLGYKNCWLLVANTLDPFRSLFLKRQSEQFNYSHDATDGEIYQKVRHYDLLNDQDSIEDWTTELTENKQNLLHRLLQQQDLTIAFDRLLGFPGLWNGNDFELGNVHKQLALHCIPQLIFYLENNIYETWDKITLGEQDIRDKLDVNTVQKLHLKAPSASALDRNYIIQQMDCSSDRSDLFPKVTETEKRALIKEALLGLKVIIPTIKSFQGNRIYFGILMNIMKTLLLDEDIPPESVYNSMLSHWTIPDTISEEVREDEFRTVTIEQPEIAFKFCLLQVILAILRHFPNLGDDGPVKERKRKRNSIAPITSGLSPVHKTKLLRLAQVVGFRTEKILAGLRDDENLPLEVLQHFPEDDYGEINRRRCGKPWTTTYMRIRTRLFLTNLLQIRTQSGPNPSALYVQRDFISAFFDLKEFTQTGPELFSIGDQDRASQTAGTSERVEEMELHRQAPQSLRSRISRSVVAELEQGSSTEGGPSTAAFSRHETSHAVVEISDDDSGRSTTVGDLGEAEEDIAVQLEENLVNTTASLPPELSSIQLMAQRRGSVIPWTSARRTPQVVFVFGEHNGMFYRRVEIPADDMERYLEQRQCWIGMIFKDGVLQTMRHEHIIKHMMHNVNDQKSFVMVKTTYIR